MQRRFLLFVDALLLVAAALLGVRLYEALTARPPTAPLEASQAAIAEPSPPPAPPAPRLPLTEFTVVAERNLFSSTRTETAPEPPRTTAGPATPPAPKPRLYGVVLLPEGRGRAYLEDVQRRRIFGYSEGDLVGDARLEQIKPDRVVLRRGGETFEVLLYDPSKPRPAAPPSGIQSPPPGVQSQPPEVGGAGRPPVARPGIPPGAGVRPPPRPRVPVPPPAPPPAAEGQEQPTTEEE